MSSDSVKKTEGTSSSQVNPWAPQAAALTDVFSKAQVAYDTAASGAKAPTDFTAQFNPEQLATFRQMIARGSNFAVPDSQAAAGGALTSAGVNGATGALSGFSDYDPSDSNNPDNLVASANKYVAGQDIDAQVRNATLQATQTARDLTLPQIEQNAALSGNTNSSRTGIREGLVERGLAQQSADLGATLRSSAFANGLSLAQTQAQNNNAAKLAALSGQGSLGTAAAGQGIDAGSSSIDNIIKQLSTASAGGAGLREADQANLTNQSQQFQAANTAPYENIKQLLSIVGGQSWGSNSTGTSSGTETKSPSIWEIIGGLAGAAGNAGELLKPSNPNPVWMTGSGNAAGGHPYPQFR